MGLEYRHTVAVLAHKWRIAYTSPISVMFCAKVKVYGRGREPKSVLHWICEPTRHEPASDRIGQSESLSQKSARSKIRWGDW